MSKKIVVFIGEGNSELGFFIEFLKNKFSVEDENIKNLITLHINDNIIIFSHPILGNNKHLGGDKTFKSDKTYVIINRKIESCKYLFPNISEYDIVYFYLTDKDNINSHEKLEGVEEFISRNCKRYTGGIIKIFAVKEIETWFLVGIGQEFIENYPELDTDELAAFYKNKDIETIDDTKELLKHILRNTKIGNSSQEFIGRDFGKYIDIEQAKSKSKSFCHFLEVLDELFEIKKS